MNEINAMVFTRLVSWWENLEDDRAGRAILKRASSITAVSLCAPYQRLYRQLLETGWPADASDTLNDRLAAVVGLLAHARGETTGTRQRNGALKPPAAMSRRDGDRPVVSELRFLRLLDSPDLEALFSGLRRILPLVGSQLDVIALAKDVLFWGDGVKKHWAYQYQWPEKS